MRRFYQDPGKMLAYVSTAAAFGACGWIAGGASFGISMASVALITLLARDSDDLQNRRRRRGRR